MTDSVRSRFTRRSLLKSVAASAVTSVSSPALIGSAFAGAKSSKICFFAALSGTFAGAGKPMADGATLAVKSLAKSYGLTIDATVVDSEGNPGKGLPKILTQIHQNDTRFFTGGTLSSTALAVSSEAAKAGGVFVTAVGADEVTGSHCNRSTFRWSVPTFGAIEQTVRPFIEMNPSARRWYTITPKYVFGEALLTNAQRILKEKGLEHAGNSYHALNETEFSGYITTAVAAKPDVLLILSFGGQSTHTLRQAVSFGVKEKMRVIVAWASGLEQYSELGSDVLEDVFLGSQYEHQIDTPQNRALVSIFQENLKTFPSYLGANGFVCNQIVLEGMRKAQSVEPAAVIRALEGLEYDGPTGREHIRSFDHQVIKPYYLCRGKKKQNKKYDQDYVEIVDSGTAFVERGQSECKMPT
ncbi:MAG: ABC transporter substrate-binding protein [Hyphomicrobiaceae bacterium]|nr:ABC transporter substrate-binding protein [Hyphomicrobiaceae bacterium]